MTENCLRESERESSILLFAASFAGNERESFPLFHSLSLSLSPGRGVFPTFGFGFGSPGLRIPYVAGCAGGTVSASLVCVGCDEVALQSLFEHP